MIVSPLWFKSVAKFGVEASDSFPVHQPIGMDVNTGGLKVKIKKFRKTDSAAARFDQLVADTHEAQDGEDTETEQKIREKLKAKLHEKMDEHMQSRIHRIAWAKERKNTTDMWRLIVAAIEGAFIEFFEIVDNNKHSSVSNVQKLKLWENKC